MPSGHRSTTPNGEHRGGYGSSATPATKLTPPPPGVAPGARPRPAPGPTEPEPSAD